MGSVVTIVGFGDSITEAVVQTPDPAKRWLNVLAGLLEAAFPGRTFNVVNSGKGGNSAREAMARFDRDVLAHDPDWLLLEFGGNNSGLRQPERAVGLEEFGRHLDDLRRRLPAKTRVMVITFPPVIDEQHAFGKDPAVVAQGGLDAMVEPYRAATRRFARAHGYPLVDLDRAIREGMGPGDKNRHILKDGVHLNEAGNRLLAELVFEVLRGELG
ncbi:MAG TPA: GDSL-type esterase/lipase family protein [Candidatus Brocadiia bacterium]|nr:GDSL-type esterase/lipase family protein [Candidatus Brocadiia bacterium]